MPDLIPVWTGRDPLLPPRDEQTAPVYDCAWDPLEWFDLGQAERQARLHKHVHAKRLYTKRKLLSVCVRCQAPVEHHTYCRACLTRAHRSR